jgi:hypothetical protein
MDPIEAYLALLEVLLITLVPVLAALTLFSWYFAWQASPYRLPVVIALSNTIIGACAGWLAFTVLYRSRNGPVPTEMLPITGTAVVALCVVPFLTTSYLVWLQARSQDQGERKHRRRDDDT